LYVFFVHEKKLQNETTGISLNKFMFIIFSNRSVKVDVVQVIKNLKHRMRQSKEIHEHIDAAKRRISSKNNAFVDRFLSLLAVVPVWPRKKELRRRAQPRLSGARFGENYIAWKSEAGVSSSRNRISKCPKAIN